MHARCLDPRSVVSCKDQERSTVSFGYVLRPPRLPEAESCYPGSGHFDGKGRDGRIDPRIANEWCGNRRTRRADSNPRGLPCQPGLPFPFSRRFSYFPCSISGLAWPRGWPTSGVANGNEAGGLENQSWSSASARSRRFTSKLRGDHDGEQLPVLMHLSKLRLASTLGKFLSWLLTYEYLRPGMVPLCQDEKRLPCVRTFLAVSELLAHLDAFRTVAHPSYL